MCGIVGVVGQAAAAPRLLEALRRLEYRGYDSAGIATLIDGKIDRRRAEGTLGNLAAALESAPLAGSTFGIFLPIPALAGKTCRWAAGNSSVR